MDEQDTWKTVGNSLPSRASMPEQRLPSTSVNVGGSKLNDSLIAERVTTLLSHYWTAADAPEVRKLQLSDWLDDLDQFPAHVVATSCQDWRRTESRRPTIADIRRVCFENMPRPAKVEPLVSAERRIWFAEREAEMQERYRLAAEWREQQRKAVEK